MLKSIPMKYRSASEWVKAYDNIHKELMVKGFKPKLQTLDNEALAALRNFFTANEVEYQSVLSQCHCRNAAERAIKKFKENFLTGLPSVDPTSPLHLWDRLLPQVEITLNLLRTLRLHTHNYPPQLTFMASLITTKQLLLHQDAKSLHTRNQESDVLGDPMGNIDIPWAQQCITTDVKM
jgi:hypothetical protein